MRAVPTYCIVYKLLKFFTAINDCVVPGNTSINSTTCNKAVVGLALAIKTHGTSKDTKVAKMVLPTSRIYTHVIHCTPQYAQETICSYTCHMLSQLRFTDTASNHLTSCRAAAQTLNTQCKVCQASITSIRSDCSQSFKTYTECKIRMCEHPVEDACELPNYCCTDHHHVKLQQDMQEFHTKKGANIGSEAKYLSDKQHDMQIPSSKSTLSGGKRPWALEGQAGFELRFAGIHLDEADPEWRTAEIAKETLAKRLTKGLAKPGKSDGVEFTIKTLYPKSRRALGVLRSEGTGSIEIKNPDGLYEMIIAARESGVPLTHLPSLYSLKYPAQAETGSAKSHKLTFNRSYDPAYANRANKNDMVAESNFVLVSGAHHKLVTGGLHILHNRHSRLINTKNLSVFSMFSVLDFLLQSLKRRHRSKTPSTSTSCKSLSITSFLSFPEHCKWTSTSLPEQKQGWLTHANTIYQNTGIELQQAWTPYQYVSTTAMTARIIRTAQAHLQLHQEHWEELSIEYEVKLPVATNRRKIMAALTRSRNPPKRKTIDIDDYQLYPRQVHHTSIIPWLTKSPPLAEHLDNIPILTADFRPHIGRPFFRFPKEAVEEEEELARMLEVTAEVIDLSEEGSIPTPRPVTAKEAEELHARFMTVVLQTVTDDSRQLPPLAQLLELDRIADQRDLKMYMHLVDLDVPV